VNLSVENRVSRLEGAYEQVGDRLNGMDANMQGLRTEFNGLRKDMNRGMAELRRDLRWILGGIGGSWLTIMLALLFHK
jgi:hypothetical protein